jgi:diaminopimelate decarboxylase
MIHRNSEGRVFIEQVPVSRVAKEFGTPVYAYSKEQIQKNARYLKQTLSQYFDHFRVQYAVKANTNPYILSILKDEGMGADCSSPYELEMTKRMGFPMERSTYTGNYESPSDLKAAVESGITVNLDDHTRLDELLSFGKPSLLSFRINPGVGRSSYEGTTTAGTDAKFGIPYEKTREAFKKALDAGVERFGIHMMTGSNNLEPFYFAEVTQKLFSIIQNSLNDLDLKLEFINIGGGLGVPYSDHEKSLDLETTVKLVSQVFHEQVSKLDIGNPALVMEPGRFLVANAGALISRVTHVKEAYKRFMGIDAGMNTLIRPSLYGAQHRIWMDGKDGRSTKTYYVCGQICENSDIHPFVRSFPEVNRGDLAVVLDTGAYGFTMASNYNNRPRPAEVLIDQNEAKLIRKAEQFEDLLSHIPQWEFSTPQSDTKSAEKSPEEVGELRRRQYSQA